jgi:hypothetical protein
MTPFIYMRRFNSIYLPAIIISIALFILGQLFFVRLFEFLEPKITGILFEITERDRALKTSLLFSLTLALIPIVLVLIWRLASITSVNKKLASMATILALAS